MASQTEIYNMALGHLGNSNLVEAPDEDSTEASVLSLYYDTARRKALAGRWWGFAKRYVILTRVDDFTSSTETHNWLYTYRYPQNCVDLRRIITGNVDEPNPPPFELGQDDSGQLVFTNHEEPKFEYTFNVTDTEVFPDTFTLAFSWMLAKLSAGTLAKVKDATNLMEKGFQIALSEANTQDAGQQSSNVTRERDAEWISDRQ